MSVSSVSVPVSEEEIVFDKAAKIKGIFLIFFRCSSIPADASSTPGFQLFNSTSTVLQSMNFDLDLELHDEDAVKTYVQNCIEKGEKIHLLVWAKHFLTKANDRIPFISKIYEQKQQYYSTHYGFLQPSQINGKTLKYFGIPHYCGEVSRDFLMAHSHLKKKGPTKKTNAKNKRGLGQTDSFDFNEIMHEDKTTDKRHLSAHHGGNVCPSDCLVHASLVRNDHSSMPSSQSPLFNNEQGAESSSPLLSVSTKTQHPSLKKAQVSNQNQPLQTAQKKQRDDQLGKISRPTKKLYSSPVEQDLSPFQQEINADATSEYKQLVSTQESIIDDYTAMIKYKKKLEILAENPVLRIPKATVHKASENLKKETEESCANLKSKGAPKNRKVLAEKFDNNYNKKTTIAARQPLKSHTKKEQEPLQDLSKIKMEDVITRSKKQRKNKENVMKPKRGEQNMTSIEKKTTENNFDEDNPMVDPGNMERSTISKPEEVLLDHSRIFNRLIRRTETNLSTSSSSSGDTIIDRTSPCMLGAATLVSEIVSPTSTLSDRNEDLNASLAHDFVSTAAIKENHAKKIKESSLKEDNLTVDADNMERSTISRPEEVLVDQSIIFNHLIHRTETHLSMSSSSSGDTIIDKASSCTSNAATHVSESVSPASTISDRNEDLNASLAYDFTSTASIKESQAKKMEENNLKEDYSKVTVEQSEISLNSAGIFNRQIHETSENLSTLPLSPDSTDSDIIEGTPQPVSCKPVQVSVITSPTNTVSDRSEDLNLSLISDFASVSGEEYTQASENSLDVFRENNDMSRERCMETSDDESISAEDTEPGSETSADTRSLSQQMSQESLAADIAEQEINFELMDIDIENTKQEFHLNDRVQSFLLENDLDRPSQSPNLSLITPAINSADLETRSTSQASDNDSNDHHSDTLSSQNSQRSTDSSFVSCQSIPEGLIESVTGLESRLAQLRVNSKRIDEAPENVSPNVSEDQSPSEDSTNDEGKSLLLKSEKDESSESTSSPSSLATNLSVPESRSSSHIDSLDGTQEASANDKAASLSSKSEQDESSQSTSSPSSLATNLSVPESKSSSQVDSLDGTQEADNDRDDPLQNRFFKSSETETNFDDFQELESSKNTDVGQDEREVHDDKKPKSGQPSIVSQKSFFKLLGAETDFEDFGKISQMQGHLHQSDDKIEASKENNESTSSESTLLTNPAMVSKGSFRQKTKNFDFEKSPVKSLTELDKNFQKDLPSNYYELPKTSESMFDKLESWMGKNYEAKSDDESDKSSPSLKLTSSSSASSLLSQNRPGKSDTKTASTKHNLPIREKSADESFSYAAVKKHGEPSKVMKRWQLKDIHLASTSHDTSDILNYLETTDEVKFREDQTKPSCKESKQFGRKATEMQHKNLSLNNDEAAFWENHKLPSDADFSTSSSDVPKTVFPNDHETRSLPEAERKEQQQKENVLKDWDIQARTSDTSSSTKTTTSLESIPAYSTDDETGGTKRKPLKEKNFVDESRAATNTNDEHFVSRLQSAEDLKWSSDPVQMKSASSTDSEFSGKPSRKRSLKTNPSKCSRGYNTRSKVKKQEQEDSDNPSTKETTVNSRTKTFHDVFSNKYDDDDIDNYVQWP